MPRLKLVLITAVCYAAVNNVTGVDRHVSPHELKEMFDKEKKVAGFIRDYLESGAEERTGELVRPLKELLIEFDFFNRHKRSSLFGNPVNIVFVFRHFRAFKEAISVLRRLSSLDWGRRLDGYYDALPDKRSVKEVTMALLRLQSVFDLRAADLVRGKILEYSSIRPMNKEECFFIAETAFEFVLKNQYKEWFEVCLRNVTYETEKKALEEEFAANLEKMDTFLKDLVQHEKRDKIFQELQKQMPMDMIGSAIKGQTEVNSGANAMLDNFRVLCQSRSGSFSLLPAEEKCILYSPDKFGSLAPFKLEYHAYDPVIVTAHDVLGGKMIANILGGVKVNGSGFRDPQGVSTADGKVSTSAARSGKVGFIPPRFVPPDFKRISAALTGLTGEFSEALQLVSYGVGGHYEPHFDYFSQSNETYRAFMRGSVESTGDRIATLLYYLNDVPEGGSTVFPTLGLAVRPEKGSALFWYNLYRSGKPDPFTIHSGCPVLIGSKIIANQWYREKGQEHVRPCALNSEL